MLEERLYRSAKRFAQRAALDLGEGRLEEFFANGGVALEHLLKAYLTTRDPLLLVGQRGGQLDPKGMLWALERPPREPPEGMVTIGCTEAVRRSSHLRPLLGKIRLDDLIAARNGVVHLATANTEHASRALVGLASAVEIVVQELGHTAADFWGYSFEAVKKRTAETVDHIRIRAAELVAAARTRFENRLKTEGNDWIGALEGIMSTMEPSELQLSANCPACGHLALMTGTTEVMEAIDVDLDDGVSHLVGVATWESFIARELKCLFCGLRLSAELMDAYGLPTEVDLSTGGDDPDDWEPDEDVARGR